MLFLLRARAALPALLLVALPALAAAQGADRTVCKDGTRRTSTAATACDGHGGINAVETSILRRTGVSEEHPTTTAPKVETRTADVEQAGRPSDRNHPHRRWRGRYPDRDERRAIPDPARNARARCRDGSYAHENGNPKNVCKHHGGVARWLHR